MCLTKKKIKPLTWERTWYDAECNQAKKRMRVAVRRWKEGRDSRENVEQLRTAFVAVCKQKKYRALEKLEKEFRECGSEKNLWDLLKEKTRKETPIRLEDWERKCREGAGVWSERRVGNSIFEGRRLAFAIEELDKAIAEMKCGKAPGDDGLKAEAWKELPIEGRRSFLVAINKIWMNEQEIPMSWRKGVVIPVFKGGNETDSDCYRGITLMNTSYKLTMSMVKTRLEEEIESRQLLPESQGGFRSGRGTREQVFILARLIEESLDRKDSFYAVFLDLKSAYDGVPRVKMTECLRRRNASEQIVELVDRVYAETWSIARVNESVSEGFRMNVGVRQGCPLSPILFNLYISEIEEVLRKGQDGGVVIGREKVWMLAYADDMVLFARSMSEMKVMIKRVERYMDKRDMVVNVGKTKWMKFRNKGRKGRDECLNWKGSAIERVSVFKYLGVWFMETGAPTHHLQMIQSKARCAWMQIERRWKKWWGGNIWIAWKLWDACVKEILLYGVEVWGWREWDIVEKERLWFLKRTLGVEKSTPKAIVRQETNHMSVWSESVIRVVKFEEKIFGLGEESLVKKVWMVMIESEGSSWRKWRRDCYASVGVSEEYVRLRMSGGSSVWMEVRRRWIDKEWQDSERELRETTYNPGFKKWKAASGTVPTYLLNNAFSADDKRLLARSRCGSEERGLKYWMGDEYRSCLLCRAGLDTWEHLAKNCLVIRNWSGISREASLWLKEDGSGMETCRKILCRKGLASN